MVDATNRRLEHAPDIIVLVDEALSISAGQVRLLTNLEKNKAPTNHMISRRAGAGGPSLAHAAHEALHRPLSRERLSAMCATRIAGAARDFPGALRELHRVSSGVPRVINVACDRALLGAYTQDVRKITPALVRRAAGEVYGRKFAPRWLAWFAGSIGLLALLGTLVAGWQLLYRQNSPLSNASQAAISTVSPPPLPTSVPAGDATPAQAAPAKAAAPKLVPVNVLLAGSEADTTDAAAYRRLLSLWGKAMSDEKDPCGQAAKSGLACLDQRGSWAQVRALNRPAILTLFDDRGQRHRVVLSSLEDETATLDLGERREKVSIDDLSRDWFSVTVV